MTWTNPFSAVMFACTIWETPSIITWNTIINFTLKFTKNNFNISLLLFFLFPWTPFEAPLSNVCAQSQFWLWKKAGENPWGRLRLIIKHTFNIYHECKDVKCNFPFCWPYPQKGTTQGLFKYTHPCSYHHYLKGLNNINLNLVNRQKWGLPLGQATCTLPTPAKCSQEGTTILIQAAGKNVDSFSYCLSLVA